jgi:hypothetical protein
MDVPLRQTRLQRGRPVDSDHLFRTDVNPSLGSAGKTSCFSRFETDDLNPPIDHKTSRLCACLPTEPTCKLRY